MPKALNGLLKIPYTEEDWLVLSIAIAGTIFKIVLMYENNEERPKIRDYISVVLVSYIVTMGYYELAILKEWSIQAFYIPFAISIIVAKDISDWIFMTEDGRKFIKNTFIVLLEKITGTNTRKTNRYEKD